MDVVGVTITFNFVSHEPCEGPPWADLVPVGVADLVETELLTVEYIDGAFCWHSG